MQITLKIYFIIFSTLHFFLKSEQLVLVQPIKTTNTNNLM